MLRTFFLLLVFIGFHSNFLANSLAEASEIEIVWLRLDTQYYYKDATIQCSTATSGKSHYAGEAYLVLELLVGKVRGARLSNYPNTFPFEGIYKAIDFLPEELLSIELFKDIKHQYWVRGFNLTDRLAKWLIYFPSQDNYRCKVPLYPYSVSPKSQTVPFETEGVEQGIETSYSNWVNLLGERPDGVRFEEKIRIVQRKVYFE